MMVLEIINSFINSAFELVVNTALSPVINIIKNFSGAYLTIILLIISLTIAYFLAKWEKFTDIVTGKLGSMIVFTILIFIILKLISGGII